MVLQEDGQVGHPHFSLALLRILKHFLSELAQRWLCLSKNTNLKAIHNNVK